MDSGSIILTEFPAPCNMKCEYCYIKPGDERRKKPFKKVAADDFKRLAEQLPVKDVAFHFCSIGDPILYPYSLKIWEELLKNFPVIINANMMSDKYESLLKMNTENLAVWFSIHWEELIRHNKTIQVFERIKRFKEAGITVWPMLVLHPSYYKHIDDILGFAKMYDLKIKIMHFRDIKKSSGPLGLVMPPERLQHKIFNHENIDISHWRNSDKRWDVFGSDCTSGIEFLVINSKWEIRSCGGKGNIHFGDFPEDLNHIELEEKGVCSSTICPCSWALFHGVSTRHKRNMPDVLHSESGELKYFYGEVDG